jgi:pilus assembly protein CpaB
MKRRGLTIALAVLLAVLGTGGVLAYVNHANARALAGQQAVTVLVARQVIPAGTSAADAQAQGLLSTERLPSASVPADALTGLTPAISSLVTDADVQPGQLLLRPMLVTSVQNTSGLAIPHGMLAVALQFCVPEAVAGHLQPGSQVAVSETTVSGSSNSNNSSLTAQAACNGPHALSGQDASTKLVLPKVKVLAVGPGTGGQGGTSTSTSTSTSNSGSGQNTLGLITLAVSQAEASQLIQLTENGLPYLALLAGS